MSDSNATFTVSIASPSASSVGISLLASTPFSPTSALISIPSLLISSKSCSTLALDSSTSSPADVSGSSVSLVSSELSSIFCTASSIASIESVSLIVSVVSNADSLKEASKSCASLPSRTISVPSTVVVIILLNVPFALSPKISSPS